MVDDASKVTGVLREMFQINGSHIDFLASTHTGNSAPIGSISIINNP